MTRGKSVAGTLRGLRLACQQLRRTAELLRAETKFRLGGGDFTLWEIASPDKSGSR